MNSFDEFVAKRCTIAIEDDTALNKLEKECTDSELIRITAEAVCYKRGFLDALEIIKKM